MRDHIYPLDVLRFLSAFGVVTFHLCFYAWASEFSSASQMLAGAARYEALAPFTWFGWVGVEVFFVISGFVIANSAHGAAPIDFLKGRMLRLYPAVWVSASITLATWLLAGNATVADTLKAYIRSMVLWLRGPWVDGVYWSLSVEIVFYGLVFWMLVFRRIVSITALPWILTGLSLFYAGVHFYPHVAEAVLSPWGVGRIEWFSGLLLMRYGAFFAIGVWAWLMSRQAMTLLRSLGLLAAIGLGLAEIVPRASGFPDEVSYAMAFPVWAPVSAWLAGVALIFAAARYPALFAVRAPWRQALFKRIGSMTYPLFLVHGVAGAALIRLLTFMGADPWAALALTIAAMLLLAYLICATAEVSIRKIMRTVLDAGDQTLRRAAPGLDFLFLAQPDRGLPAPRASSSNSDSVAQGKKYSKSKG